MYCEKCGRSNPPYASFCSNCGNNLHTQQDKGTTHNINFNIGRQYNPYKTNSYAIWSLILACVSFVFGWAITAVIAIVLGHSAKEQIQMSNEQGANLATAGIVLGWVNIGLTIAAVFLFIVLGSAFSIALSGLF